MESSLYKFARLDVKSLSCWKLLAILSMLTLACSIKGWNLEISDPTSLMNFSIVVFGWCSSNPRSSINICITSSNSIFSHSSILPKYHR
ncbi:hypothetical protein LINPERHAP1_LOCUS38016 [Linum perenne]